METLKESKEIVALKTLQAWKMKLQHGHKTAIATRFDIPRSEVITAFEGLATPTVIKAINEFYQLNAA